MLKPSDCEPLSDTLKYPDELKKSPVFDTKVTVGNKIGTLELSFTPAYVRLDIYCKLALTSSALRLGGAMLSGLAVVVVVCCA